MNIPIYAGEKERAKMAKKKHQINQMSSIITARIDVQKIDKSRLYKGKKGTYLDIVLIPTLKMNTVTTW